MTTHNLRLAPLQLDIKLPECLKGSKEFATTWEEHLKIYGGYPMRSLLQDAERIAERGGFGIYEAYKYYGWKRPVVLMKGIDNHKGWRVFTFCIKNKVALWAELHTDQLTASALEELLEKAARVFEEKTCEDLREVSEKFARKKQATN